MDDDLPVGAPREDCAPGQRGHHLQAHHHALVGGQAEKRLWCSPVLVSEARLPRLGTHFAGALHLPIQLLAHAAQALAHVPAFEPSSFVATHHHLGVPFDHAGEGGDRVHLRHVLCAVQGRLAVDILPQILGEHIFEFKRRRGGQEGLVLPGQHRVHRGGAHQEHSQVGCVVSHHQQRILAQEGEGCDGP